MKKILCLGLALVMLFALVCCNGRETQEKLAELEAKLQEESSKIDALEEENETQLDKITELENNINGLEQENERLEEEINEYKFGEYYTIQAAYDKGLITIEDLTELASYCNNGIDYPYDYLGSTKALNLGGELIIRLIYTLKYVDVFNYFELETFLDGVSIEKYYGKYSGCYIVMLDTVFVSRPAVDYTGKFDYIAGVKIDREVARFADVFKFEERG